MEDGCARTKAADGDLHVLGIVVAVQRDDARRQAQGVGEIDLIAGVGDEVLIDEVCRGRCVELFDLESTRCDFHRRQSGPFLAQAKQGSQQGAGQIKQRERWFKAQRRRAQT